MDQSKVLKLATLARIEISEEEAKNLSHEFDAILGYVGEVKEATKGIKTSEEDLPPLKNVLREDGEPHESGIYTKKILSQSPDKDGDYIRVKNIL